MPHVPLSSPLLVRPGVDLRGPGGWDEVFGRRAPLEVEVGFGRDDALLRRCGAHPDRDFVGVELKKDRVATYLRRASRLGLRNLRVVAGRAEVVVGLLLPDARVAVVRALFPDPWPKGRHAGHRLLRPFFVREVRRVLEPGGLLALATDDAAYAAEMRDSVEGAGGFEGGPAAAGDGRDLFDGTTIFERRGIAQGSAIARLLYRRVA